MAQPFLINSDVADRLSPTDTSRAGIGRLVGASMALASVELATTLDAPLLLIASDPRHADQLEAEIRWFAGDSLAVMHFVEWETLPYDSFSPHQDIISARLRVLSLLPGLARGIVIVSGPSLLQRLPPVEYVSARTLELHQDQALDRRAFIDSLAAALRPAFTY